MTRLNFDEEADSGKSATSKKKSAAKKKNPSTGIWPCTINGCTKQFAREADLKRHQRTTKLHSIAGYACALCEATFTRTDALRRHQKSRHNGAIFDPVETETFVQESQDDSTASSSKAKESDTTMIPETIQGAPSVSGPATGHSSYYREHTAASASYLQHARPVTGSEWINGHSWSNGNPPGRSTYMYSPHYRRDDPSQSPVAASNSPHSEDGNDQQSSSGHRSASTGSPHSQIGELTSPPLQAPTNYSAPDVPAPIPPLPPPVTLERLLLEANAARTAELSSSEDQCTHEGFGPAIKPLRTWTVSPINVNMHAQDSNGHGDNSSSVASDSPTSSRIPEHGYSARLSRPEPADPSLMEGDEPMLNPAELLTQESLASSPEPS